MLSSLFFAGAWGPLDHAAPLRDLALLGEEADAAAAARVAGLEDPDLAPAQRPLHRIDGTILSGLFLWSTTRRGRRLFVFQASKKFLVLT